MVRSTEFPLHIDSERLQEWYARVHQHHHPEQQPQECLNLHPDVQTQLPARQHCQSQKCLYPVGQPSVQRKGKHHSAGRFLFSGSDHKATRAVGCWHSFYHTQDPNGNIVYRQESTVILGIALQEFNLSLSSPLGLWTITTTVNVGLDFFKCNCVWPEVCRSSNGGSDSWFSLSQGVTDTKTFTVEQNGNRKLVQWFNWTQTLELKMLNSVVNITFELLVSTG